MTAPPPNHPSFIKKTIPPPRKSGGYLFFKWIDPRLGRRSSSCSNFRSVRNHHHQYPQQGKSPQPKALERPVRCVSGKGTTMMTMTRRRPCLGRSSSRSLLVMLVVVLVSTTLVSSELTLVPSGGESSRPNRHCPAGTSIGSTVSGARKLETCRGGGGNVVVNGNDPPPSSSTTKRVPRAAWSWWWKRQQQRPVVLVVGATGGTGRHVVHQLLKRGCTVHVIVRSTDRMVQALSSCTNHTETRRLIPRSWRNRLHMTQASLLDDDVSMDELVQLVEPVDAVVCCLGHSLTLSGLWGPPYRLVTTAIQRLTTALQRTMTTGSPSSPHKPKQLILLSSDGVRNRHLDNAPSWSTWLLLGLIRLLLPPHVDNEQAAAYLWHHHQPSQSKQSESNQAPRVEWVIVRPTDMVPDDNAEERGYHSRRRRRQRQPGYQLQSTPEGPLFGGSHVVSRRQVAECMVHLLTRPPLWKRWKFQMPVVYNNNDDDKTNHPKKQQQEKKKTNGDTAMPK